MPRRLSYLLDAIVIIIALTQINLNGLMALSSVLLILAAGVLERVVITPRRPVARRVK